MSRAEKEQSLLQSGYDVISEALRATPGWHSLCADEVAFPFPRHAVDARKTFWHALLGLDGFPAQLLLHGTLMVGMGLIA